MNGGESALFDKIYTVVLYYFTAVNSCYSIIFVLSLIVLQKRFSHISIEDFDSLANSRNLPPVTILMPAYNEERNITDTIQSFLRLRYPTTMLVVVNDGSRDKTMECLKENLDLVKVVPPVLMKVKSKQVRAYYQSRKHRQVMVVDKENGGKADALNAGINVCQTPFFTAIDADTIAQPDTLLHLIRPVLAGAGTAAGISIGITNGCLIREGRLIRPAFPTEFLSAVQGVEYLRGFLFGRLGWNIMGGSFIISGAYGFFNTQAVVECGGYEVDTVGEDVELTVRLHHEMKKRKRPYNIQFIADPSAWTEVPSDFRSFGNQRERWHRGLIDTMVRHRSMLFNPRYGWTGLVAFPFYLVAELLHPIFELGGYILLIVGVIFGWLDWTGCLLFLCLSLGFTVALSFFAIIIEAATFRRYGRAQNLFGMGVASVVECFGYHQYTMFCKLKSFWNYFSGSKSWGKIKRTGY